MNPFDLITDPLLRAPVLGSMLMCLASALIGTIAVTSHRSLVGEALSHASYPGVVLSLIVAGSFFPGSDVMAAALVLVGSFLSALFGLFVISWLQKRYRVHSDAALCLVLSLFFGVGVLIASAIQLTRPLWYRQIQMFLYGQAATMLDGHVWVYAILNVVVIISIFLLYRSLQMIYFDPTFAASLGLKVKGMNGLVFVLLALAVVIGIRSVGVVLMSGMLIAPVVAARQLSARLSVIFVWAAFFGVCSGYLGNYLSLAVPIWAVGEGMKPLFSLPTGPMILLCAASLSILALVFSPNTGLLSRYVRILRFRGKCREENLLKAMWKKGEASRLFLHDIVAFGVANRLAIWLWLKKLTLQGWIVRKGDYYSLTADGWSRASRLVRLHRLWEVYLVDYLGQGAEKVHRSAEEMEHIITADLEKQLTELLKHPKHDPHFQPIPK